MKLKITNATIITPYRYIRNGTVIVENGVILGIHQGNIDFLDAETIDAAGNYVAPGFIDLHIHGGGNHDFMDGSVEAFLGIAETHAKYGTTAMVPTTLTSEKEDLLETLDLYEKANALNTKGAQFLGMHLEGPYFALSQRGAQDPRYIRNPDPAEYEEVLAYSSSIARWSAAPELPGAIDFGKRLKQKGILAAVAHTDAIYEDVLEAYENGYTLATHLYSAMSGVTRRNAFRYAGTIESAFLLDMDVEIIADGLHLPAPLLKLIYKIKGPDRIALITDAMRAAGMPEGESTLGSLKNGLKVIVEDGVAKLPDRTSFAGSVSTADRLVRNMVQMADVSLLDAVRMMSATPARIMGVDGSKGTLVAGKDADIVIFNENIEVQTTIVRGKVIYQKEKNTI
ncbi:N-acetylglucosamine-6-phosphate deacetylase [Dyadobacter sandarakinus]|uniref:N-acetylglucosamine-6-phosphate deacetylase n=1 Tax=Dyadobacter sandarakinus TaxID=2747268 RepID=A0ABX7I7X2_9BACT|nr:N-acetylglucosamine-6-phosphate deacetylase [Dyadobacter sandarakinus]QRR02194.1 N-acetylglucosamine-6-phosphate deacetylase [Dyadobacter sandarakinus]